MNVGQICQRRVVTVQSTDELRTAAKLMRESHVGSYCRLVGVISLDDILRQHADEVGAAAGIITKGRELESHARG